MSKLVTVSLLVALCGAICHSAPAGFGISDTPNYDGVICHVLQVFANVLEHMIKVDDPAKAKLYADLVKCYDGAILPTNPHYKFCRDNKDQLLKSYYANLGTLTGRSLLVPLEFLKDFKVYIQLENRFEKPLIDNLREYPGIWNSAFGQIQFTDSCKRMIEQVDVGFGQWGYNVSTVTEFFEERVGEPLFGALQLCRQRVKA